MALLIPKEIDYPIVQQGHRWVEAVVVVHQCSVLVHGRGGHIHTPSDNGTSKGFLIGRCNIP